MGVYKIVYIFTRWLGNGALTASIEIKHYKKVELDHRCVCLCVHMQVVAVLCKYLHTHSNHYVMGSMKL